MRQKWQIVGLFLLLAGCAAPAPAPQTAAEVAPAAEEAAPAAEEAASAQVVIAPGQTIRIGGSFALTGPIPDPGKDIRQAAEIAVDELNAAGGIDGFLFELVAEDGACSGDQGTVVGNNLRQTRPSWLSVAAPAPEKPSGSSQFCSAPASRLCRPAPPTRMLWMQSVMSATVWR